MLKSSMYTPNRNSPTVKGLRSDLQAMMPIQATRKGHSTLQKVIPSPRVITWNAFNRKITPIPMSSRDMTSFSMPLIFNLTEKWGRYLASFLSSDFICCSGARPSSSSVVTPRVSANWGRMEISGQERSFSHLLTA